MKILFQEFVQNNLWKNSLESESLRTLPLSPRLFVNDEGG